METIDKTAPATQQPDQNTTSLDLMNRMKMHGMAEAFRESLAGTTAQSMTPDSFLSMLLHREWDWRAQAAVMRLTKKRGVPLQGISRGDRLRHKPWTRPQPDGTSGDTRLRTQRTEPLHYRVIRNGQELPGLRPGTRGMQKGHTHPVCQRLQAARTAQGRKSQEQPRVRTQENRTLSVAHP